MDKTNKKSFKDMLEEMKRVATEMSNINEAYIFDDAPGEGGMMGPEEQQMVPQEGMPMQQQPQGDSEEERAMHAQEMIQHEPIVGKIREIAIDGLKKYADHPTHILYEFFKKTLLECDKVLTDVGGKK